MVVAFLERKTPKEPISESEIEAESSQAPKLDKPPRKSPLKQLLKIFLNLQQPKKQAKKVPVLFAIGPGLSKLTY